MKKRNILNSPRFLKLKKKKRKVLKIKMFFLIILFFLILLGLSFFYQWEEINISNVQILGNKAVETKTIENIVRKNMMKTLRP